MIKSRKAKNSKRGLYLQDKEIQQTNFEVGTNFTYVIDKQNKKIIISPSEQTSDNTVSKRTTPTGLKPVIDIRNKKALSVFNDADYLQVDISQNQIIVTGYDHSSATDNEQSSKLSKNLFSTHKRNFEISSLLDVRKKFEVRLSQQELAKVVGEVQVEQLSLFDSIKNVSSYSSASVKNIQSGLRQLHIPLQLISLFSGAGVMDYGFSLEGFDVAFALELSEEAVETYKANHSSKVEVADITTFDKNRFGHMGAPVMIGGSPCQGFSQANRQSNFLDNPNNLLVKEYIESIKANPNCQVFVLENVPKLLTAGNGKFKDEICKELSDFEITTGILTATDFGEAQERKRAFIIGSKIGKINLPVPTHAPEQYTTVREAFEGLHDSIPNQKDHSIPREATIERMKVVPEGGNWRAFPDCFKTKSMFTGSTHSSIYKRLEWDKPSITIANPRKSNITHPSENRSLSVRECARLFGLPDDFTFRGSLSSMQQQICNAVPVKMAKAIAKSIKSTILQYNNRNTKGSLQLI